MHWLAGFALWALLLPVHAHAPHDFHVSLTQIEHNAQAGTLEITTKIFSDDLEKTLETLGAPRLHLGSPQEHPQSDSLIGAYLANRLQIKVDGNPMAFRFIGKEVEMDATWCYLEMKLGANPQRLDIQNRILFELYADQSNLLHFHANGRRQSLLFDQDAPSGCLFF